MIKLLFLKPLPEITYRILHSLYFTEMYSFAITTITYSWFLNLLITHFSLLNLLFQFAISHLQFAINQNVNFDVYYNIL